MYQLNHGDGFDVIDSMEDESVDLVLTDPPYGITQAHWDKQLDLELWWSKIWRVCKPRTPIVMFGAQPFTSYLVVAGAKFYKHMWVWDKTWGLGPLTARFRPMLRTEDIAVFGRGGINYYPVMEKRDKPVLLKGKVTSKLWGKVNNNKEPRLSTHKFPTNIIVCKPVPHSQAYHSTEKPQDLLKYLLETYSRPGDLVLDPFMGSASCCVACMDTGRDFIGSELDKHIYPKAVGRVNKHLERIGGQCGI